MADTAELVEILSTPVPGDPQHGQLQIEIEGHKHLPENICVINALTPAPLELKQTTSGALRMEPLGQPLQVPYQDLDASYVWRVLHATDQGIPREMKRVTCRQLQHILADPDVRSMLYWACESEKGAYGEDPQYIVGLLDARRPVFRKRTNGQWQRISWEQLGDTASELAVGGCFLWQGSGGGEGERLVLDFADVAPGSPGVALFYRWLSQLPSCARTPAASEIAGELLTAAQQYDSALAQGLVNELDVSAPSLTPPPEPATHPLLGGATADTAAAVGEPAAGVGGWDDHAPEARERKRPRENGFGSPLQAGAGLDGAGALEGDGVHGQVAETAPPAAQWPPEEPAVEDVLAALQEGRALATDADTLQRALVVLHQRYTRCQQAFADLRAVLWAGGAAL